MSKDTFNINTGTKIRNLRISLGYSKEQFANTLDISVSSLSNVESGKNGISVSLLRKLFSVFGVSSDFIINENTSSNYIYLFKTGIFFIAIDKDADICNKIANLKLTPLTSNIMKCGFPTNQLIKYTNIFKKNNISFLIIDDTTDVSPITLNTYLSNTNFSKFIDKIKNLDLISVTPIQSLNLLIEFKNLLETEELY